jgi:CHAT domain-containing protein/tetratricopeptide (TPR) repeat protein
MKTVAKWLGVLAAVALAVPATQSPGLGHTQLEPRNLSNFKFRLAFQRDIYSSLWPFPDAPEIGLTRKGQGYFLLENAKNLDAKNPYGQVEFTPSELEQKPDESEWILAQQIGDERVLLQVSGYLAEGDEILQDGSLYDIYTFDGQTGQRIEIRLSSNEFDTYLILVGPNGEWIEQDDDGGGELNSAIYIELSQTGKYSIFANSYDGSGRGGYTLEVTEISNDNFISSQSQREINTRASRLLDAGLRANNIGRFQEAINLLTQALELYRALEDQRGEANAIGNLGNSYNGLAQHEEAIELYQQALRIFYTTDNQQYVAYVLADLGFSHSNLGNYQQAIDFSWQSLEVARSIGNRQAEAVSLGMLGYIYIYLGQYQQSISLSQLSLDIAREIGSQELEGSALGNLGFAYGSLGQNQRAIEFHQGALTIHRETGDMQGQAKPLGGLALVYHSLDEYHRAIYFYEQQLAISQDIGDRSTEAAALSGLGRAYAALGQYHRAFELYEQDLAVTHEIDDLAGEAITLSNQSVIYLATQQFSEAQTLLFKAVDILDLLRTPDLNDADKIALFEIQEVTFRLLQQALVAQDKHGLALTIAERGRAQAFAELLSQQLAAEDTSVTSESPNIEAIQVLAHQQQTTLVEYSILRNAELGSFLYVWVISPDGTIAFRQQPLTDVDLAALITDTRDALGVGEYSRAGARPRTNPRDLARLREEADENLRQLHHILIDPIADLLPTDPNQKVAFIPQGELFLVPFPALKDANGDYLIENHTILTAPSIQVLQLTHDLQSPSPSASTPLSLSGDGPANPLIVGDPTMPTVTFLSEAGNFESVRLQPLYGARQEAEAVGATLNAAALLGADATEARVKQQIASADLIHLATHGLLEYGDPRQTGSRDTPGAIALAPGNGEDGLLTSTEILQMELQADLVVLSACDTGRGRITGDGVIGLSRSFIAAGVPSVIVSLWAVPDAPTAELMSEFYDQLAQGQTKAQALRQAMLITMQTRPDPKDWAAFTLIGNAE